MVHGIEGDIRPFDIHRGKGAGRLKPERTVLQVLLCRAKGQIVFRVRWWAANAWHRRTVNNPAAYHDLLHEILGDHCITLCYVGRRPRQFSFPPVSGGWTRRSPL